MTASTSLATIIAHARAGALDRAWAMFEAAGAAEDDPAALAVKGRLLKDRALRTTGAARADLYREAAASYARAAALGEATYPLINAATLSLLAGDRALSADLARQVLARIADHPDEPETPYYRAATRAEALLLLGDGAAAQGALGEAMALAPRAWEDHASTLRQFALILAARGADAGWLDPLRPPRSLHFGGHMSFRADSQPAALIDEIAALLAGERIGFGYGALAAGADILVAEALIARGAELHLLIPGGIAAFAALSVEPFGAAWRRRFDAVLARADTVRAVAPVGTPPDAAMIGLADDVAMGAALANARRLASEAVQLLVLADAGDDASSRSGATWLEGDPNRRQRILIAPRECGKSSTLPAAEPGRRALAILAIRRTAADGQAPPVESEWLSSIKTILDRGPAPAAGPGFTGEAVVVAYDAPGAAAEMAAVVARSLAAAVSIGGHYGVADLVHDPFSGGARVTGRPPAIAAAASCLAGSICISEDFAAVLEVANGRGFGSEFIGELADPSSAPIGLHALKRRS